MIQQHSPHSMDQSMYSAMYSVKSVRVPRRQSLQDYFTMVKTLLFSEILSLILAIHNHRRQLSPIIVRQLGLLMTQSNRDGAKQWICDIIGYAINADRATFILDGDLGTPTWLIIPQNTIHQLIIVNNATSLCDNMWTRSFIGHPTTRRYRRGTKP